MAETPTAYINSDGVIMGILALCLGFVFYTANSKHVFWQRFYHYVPALLLCYLLPSLFNSFKIFNGDTSQIYYVTSRFLLPASLVLLTLSIDLKKIMALGPKALIMFLTGTAGVIIGGPFAILIMAQFSPETVGGSAPNEIWRGMTTIAGSWIGGGANQAAMYETFNVSQSIFPVMIAVDVIIANLWMAVLLFMASKAKQLDAARGADTTAIEDVRHAVEQFEAEHARKPSLPDLMLITSIGLGTTGIAHFLADAIAPWIGHHFPFMEKLSLTSTFFWLITIATTIGLLLSFTPAKKLEGAGASKIGSVFIYFLVASIGMQMDIQAILEHTGMIIVGLIWIGFHAGLLLIVGKLIKAPVFFIAVGSQANIGGAASAPIVASAFHPALAPVGVLLAVLGYALGTYGAWVCGILMQMVAPVT